MKKTLLITACLFAFGCTDHKAEEKASLDQVLRIHDKVMQADEQLMKDKMKLDTLLKRSAGKDTSGNQQIRKLESQLVKADAVMENWMHKFDPDFTGKPHEYVMDYLAKQKREITDIDSQMKAAVNTSEAYLNNIKAK